MAEGKRKLVVEIAGDASKLSSAFDDAGKKADGLGAKFAGLGKMVALGLFAGGLAAGAALVKIGGDLDEVSDHFRTTTGATGKALDALNKDFAAVARTVPENFAAVGETLATLNQQVGLTGKPLQTLGKQFLDLSRITKTDVAENVKSATSAFNAWGITGKNQSDVLDKLYRVSQSTGVGVAELSESLASNQTVLKASGLSFQSSAALLGLLGKAGLDAGTVMPAFSKALAVAAKDGKDSSVFIRETWAAIADAPNATDAAGIALDVFGAKAGPKLALAIRDGKLSYQDLLATIQSGDTIAKASADTADFAEKFAILKNRVSLAVAPLAEDLFGAITSVADAALKYGPAIVNFGKDIKDNTPLVIGLAAAIGGPLVAALVSYAASVAAAAAAQVVALAPWIAAAAALGVLAGSLTWVAERFGHVQAIVLGVAAGFAMLAAVIFGAPIAAVVAIGAAVAALGATVLWVWDKIGGFGGALSWLGDVAGSVFGAIGGAIGGLASTVERVGGSMFSPIADGFRAAINFVIRGWNRLHFTMPSFEAFGKKIGGMTIGVSPMATLHTGGTFLASTPGGEGLALLRDREQVIPPRSSLAGAAPQPTTVTNNQYVTVDATGMRPDDVIELIRKFERQNGASWRASVA